jgi:2'-5' RNA ligase
MRLFIAIEVPESLKRELAAVQDKLKAAAVNASWTRSAGMHLTLQFLGEVPETNVTKIVNALADVAGTRSGFSIGIAGIGAFPDQKNARVVWAGVDGDVAKLSTLRSAVEDAMAALGFDRDRRSFTPHLTLGRIKHIPARDRWLNSLNGVKGLALPAFEVHDILLIKSELRLSGAAYTELGRFTLTQA